MKRFTPPEVENEAFLDFGAAIQANARDKAERPAIILGETSLTWADFGAMVAQVAGKLRAEGIGRGHYVASLAENSIGHIVLYSAVVAAGACIVPLPFSATPEALTRMVEDSGSRLLFASAAQRQVAEGLGAEQVIGMETVTDWAADAEPAAPADVAPDDLFNIIYSSGTTGLPKGILHDHRFRSRQLRRITNFGMTGDDTMVISTPIYSNTTLFGMLPALSLGATLIVMAKFNTLEFLDLSQRHRPTHAILVPVQYMRRVEELGSNRLGSNM